MTVSVTPLPTPVPQRSDPANFATRADAFLAALPTFGSELNTQNAENNALNSSTNAAKLAAEAAKSDAQAAEGAAQAHANAAAANTNAPAFVANFMYAEGALVYSTVTGRTYRRKTAGAAATNPASDPTNWVATVLDVSSQRPSRRPSMMMDFAGSESIDPRLVNARASTATYFGRDGLLKTAAANQIRLDYDPITRKCLGILSEDTRTNTKLYSQSFATAQSSGGYGPVNVTPTDNSAVAPDGTMTASLVTENTVTGFHQFQFTGSVVLGTSYTASCYFKNAVGSRLIRIGPGGASAFGTNQVFITVNPADGTVHSMGPMVTHYSVVSLPNGWFRVTVTGLAVDTFTAVNLGGLVGMTDPSGFLNYVGDGTSGVYMWGFQIEEAPFPSSYIPTTTAAVTRAADNITSTVGVSSYSNNLEGTLYAEGDSSYFAGSTYGSIFGIDNGGNFEQITLHHRSNAVVTMNSGGVGQANFIATGQLTAGVNSRMALTYKLDRLRWSTAGSLYTDSEALMPAAPFTRIRVGRPGVGTSSSPFGHIRKIAVWPYAISDEELVGLTS